MDIMVMDIKDMMIMVMIMLTERQYNFEDIFDVFVSDMSMSDVSVSDVSMSDVHV